MVTFSELDKQRDIVFTQMPDGQLQRALQFFSCVHDCAAHISAASPNTLSVSYNLQHHTLEELENLLTEAGFQLDHSVLRNIERNIIYYCEDTICHNMDVPAHPTKKNEREVFVKAYEHEQHGDCDDSPPELRDYK